MVLLSLQLQNGERGRVGSLGIHADPFDRDTIQITSCLGPCVYATCESSIHFLSSFRLSRSLSKHNRPIVSPTAFLVLPNAGKDAEADFMASTCSVTETRNTDANGYRAAARYAAYVGSDRRGQPLCCSWKALLWINSVGKKEKRTPKLGDASIVWCGTPGQRKPSPSFCFVSVALPDCIVAYMAHPHRCASSALPPLYPLAERVFVHSLLPICLPRHDRRARDRAPLEHTGYVRRAR